LGSQRGDRAGEPGLREAIEQFINRHGRVPESCGLRFQHTEHGSRGEVDKVKKEDVGGLGLML